MLLIGNISVTSGKLPLAVALKNAYNKPNIELC